MRIFPALCFLFLFGSSALAFNPSFDCSVPGGPLRKLICSDYALAHADRLLAETNANLEKREATGSDYFAHSQLFWMDAVEKSCAVAAMGAAAKACVSDAYRDRKEKLRAIAGCSGVSAEAGATLTLKENNFTFAPKGTRAISVSDHKSYLLSGDYNRINIRHGEVQVIVPANAQGPFNNLVDTCGSKKQ